MRNFPKFIFSLNFLYTLLIAAETAAIIFLCLYLPSFMPVAAVFVVIWVISLTAVIAVAGRDGSPEINCALALMVIALPWRARSCTRFPFTEKRNGARSP